MNEFDYVGAMLEFRRLTGTGALKAANLILADLLDALVQRATTPTVADAAQMVSFLHVQHARAREAIPFCQIVETQQAAALPEATDELEDEAAYEATDRPGVVGSNGGPRKRRPRSPDGVRRPRMTAAERALHHGK
jgi:hypothetical protein